MEIALEAIASVTEDGKISLDFLSFEGNDRRFGRIFPSRRRRRRVAARDSMQISVDNARPRTERGRHPKPMRRERGARPP